MPIRWSYPHILVTGCVTVHAFSHDRNVNCAVSVKQKPLSPKPVLAPATCHSYSVLGSSPVTVRESVRMPLICVHAEVPSTRYRSEYGTSPVLAHTAVNSDCE